MCTLHKRNRPGQLAKRAVRAVFFSLSASYCFGGFSAGGVAGAVPSADLAASAAEPAAWAAESAADLASAAAPAAWSAAGAAGGGVAACSVPADSCFAQAVSISAATTALRASLVFIDRYPEWKQELY